MRRRELLLRWNIARAVDTGLIHHVVVKVIELRIHQIEIIFLTISVIHTLRLVQFLQILFHFKMGVEIYEALTHYANQVHLVQEYRVKRTDVLFDVRAWLVHIMEEDHLLFDQVDHIIDVLSMAANKLFLLFKDHLDEFLMILADTVYISTVLGF